MKAVITLFICLVISGCTSSFDQSSKIKSINYEIGKTQKSEIIEYIGLPDVYLHKDEIEILGYKGAADSTNHFIPLPVHATNLGGGMHLVTYLNAGVLLAEEEKQLKESDILFIFDSNQILKEVRNNKE